MPCYLFTFHVYPDHRRGVTRRKEGVVPQDKELAAAYAREAKQEKVDFCDAIQNQLIDESQNNTKWQKVRLHYIATDATHVHILVSWKEFTPWLKVRTSLKSSLTRRLNRDVARRTWFAEKGSRKRVKDRQHFNYLVNVYLSRHTGWKWSEEKGLFK